MDFRADVMEQKAYFCWIIGSLCESVLNVPFVPCVEDAVLVRSVDEFLNLRIKRVQSGDDFAVVPEVVFDVPVPAAAVSF